MGQILWSPDRSEKLRRLWEDGLSCAIIGQRLGVTRNAVIGRVRRMGLAYRTADATMILRAAGRAARQAPVRMPRIEEPKPRPQIEEPEPLLPYFRVLVKGEPVTLETVEDGMCRWPLTGTGIDMELCGHVTDRRSRFCHFHHKAAVLPKAKARPMVRPSLSDMQFRGGR